MIISHKYKYLFIEAPKTGTTSTGSILRKFDGSRNMDKYQRHASLRYAFCMAPITKKYFKFAFTRNPYDRVYSFYLFKKYKSNTDLPSPDISFIEYLNIPHFKNTQTFCDLFAGKPEMDFIGRFENLQQDFNTVCDRIGIPRQELPHASKTNHKHYTEYYDDETREIVATKYAKDIEYFGYKFGE